MTMEQNEVVGQGSDHLADPADKRSPAAASPQSAGGRCGCGGSGGSDAESAGTALGSYVYALGRVEPRFPSVGVEKEFAQATGRAGTAGLTDRQAVHSVLTQRGNRYLARQLCWVLTIEGLETY